MEKATRVITDEELLKRYGEKGKDFMTFPDDLGGQMVKVHYLKDDQMKIDLIFSAWLPVSENNELIDPTKPSHFTVYEERGYEIEFFTLTGGYWRHTNELHLTAANPNSALRVYTIKRADGKKISINLAKKLTATNGKIEFVITKLSEDKKSATVYVMVTATEKLENLTIRLEV